MHCGFCLSRMSWFSTWCAMIWANLYLDNSSTFFYVIYSREAQNINYNLLIHLFNINMDPLNYMDTYLIFGPRSIEIRGGKMSFFTKFLLPQWPRFCANLGSAYLYWLFYFFSFIWIKVASTSRMILFLNQDFYVVDPILILD